MRVGVGVGVRVGLGLGLGSDLGVRVRSRGGAKGKLRLDARRSPVNAYAMIYHVNKHIPCITYMYTRDCRRCFAGGARHCFMRAGWFTAEYRSAGACATCSYSSSSPLPRRVSSSKWQVVGSGE